MSTNSEANNFSAESLAKPGYMVSKVVQADVEELVRLHMEAFQGFFLALLGQRFVAEVYRGFLGEPDAIFLKVKDGPRLAGFVVGTTMPDAFFRKLLVRRWLSFVRTALNALWRRPWLVSRKLFSALSYRGERPPGMPGRSALLSSVAVHPQFCGKGIGSILVEAFCDRAARAGSQSVYLTTDRDDNEAVNRFYLHANFVLESDFRRTGNRWMNRYIRILCVDASSPSGKRVGSA
jgi:ribosomal protein S18 acetylase RimI-like enzyme